MLAPGKQEWSNEYERLAAAAIPGYAALMGENRIDIFTGKDLEPGFPTNIFNALLPFEVQGEGSTVAKTLGEAGVEVNIGAADAIKGIELTGAQKVQFDRYVYESGLGENLESLMNRDWWKEDFEAWKKSGRAFDPNSRWGEAILDEFEAAKKYAREKIARTDKDLGAQMIAQGQIKRANQTGNYERANELEELATFGK